MITAAIAQEQSVSFELYVGKYRSLLDIHGVPFGSPRDLPAFIQQLNHNKPLAMDFWALTGRISSREGGDLSDEEMLALIVESVAGDEVPEFDGDVRAAAHDLSRLIAGVDIMRPIDPYPFVRMSVPPTEIREWAVPAVVKKPVDDEAPRIPSNSPLDLVTESVPEPPLSTRQAASIDAHEADDEATELVERKSPQQELYFDKVDSAVEPDQAEPNWMRSADGEATRIALEKTRLVLEPDPLPEEDSFIGEGAGLPSAPVLLQSESDEGRSRRVAVFAGLLLVVCGGVFVQQRYGSVLKERYSSLTQSHRAKPLPVDVATSNSSPVIAPAPPKAVTSASVGSGVASPEQPAPIAVTNAPKQVAPASKPKKSASLRAPAVKKSVQRPTTDKRVVAPAEATINVAPSVVARNLESSRVAIYPAAAKLAHVQGRVAVRAVISKDGAVSEAQALDGNRMLRSAAVDAVRRWRYRPFLYKGKPAEVATTVTVDFKLNR